MRSRTSFFNKAFSLSLLRRFWPLWLLWLAVLTLAILGPAGNRPETYESYLAYVSELNYVLLLTGAIMAGLCIIAGPIMAMAMLGYLYNPRSANMVAALPMKREEAYFTAVLTGLAPMLLCEALTWLLMLARFGGIEGVNSAYIHQWLGLVVMGNVAFYGMACFCGTLTGNTVVLPLVYLVLNFTVMAVEAVTKGLLTVLVYGYHWDGLIFDWLSPIPHFLDGLGVDKVDRFDETNMAYYVEGVPYLASLCAVGIVLILLGALILKKRHMETAGDVVAVPVLRPIFRVCMAVGTGLVFSAAFADGYFANLMGGPSLAAVTFLLLILGAALGWFAAEMLMKKTLRVFRSGWKGLTVVCVFLVLPFLLAELDVTGYEKRVPDPETVESIGYLYSDYEPLREPESIAAFCDFHRRLVDHKAENDGARSNRYTTVYARYTLKDGRALLRQYHIPNDEQTQSDPDSDIAALETLYNLPEAVMQRVGAGLDVSAENIDYAYVTVMEQTNRSSKIITERATIELTPEQAASLYEEGILPDAREGNIGVSFAWTSDERRAEESNVSLRLTLRREETADGRHPGAAPDYSYSSLTRSSISLKVLMRSRHTIRWLEENLDLTPVPAEALEK